MTAENSAEIFHRTNLKSEQRWLRGLDSNKKNHFLLELANDLDAAVEQIIGANATDLAALSKDVPLAFRDRLLLSRDRLKAMGESLRFVAGLPDPVGEVTEARTLPNGLLVERIRAPLGVLLFIFESRPNVLTEALSLAWKSGNAIVLRGGKESARTTLAIAEVFSRVFEREFSGLEAPFSILVDFSREKVAELLQRRDLFDVVVPRGGDRLIEFVSTTSKIPIIKNDRGLCHTFVDESAPLRPSVQVVYNAKVSRPGVCNSLETVLIHEKIAEEFLAMLFCAMRGKEVQWQCCPHTLDILKASPVVIGYEKYIQAASDKSWDTEHLDFIINCRIVKSLGEALEHIERHGSRHSEAILTENLVHRDAFLKTVDAAAVYWNASTRFTDGFELGLGGELGISTQKLHVRGPVGLRELTSTRWLIRGAYQVR